MKTIKILLLIFLSWNSFSQKKIGNSKEPDTTKTYFVIYDFKSGKYKKALLKPIVDRPIVYKVININRLAYDVTINPSDMVVAETDLYTSAEDLKKVTNLISEAKINTINEVIEKKELNVSENLSKDQNFTKDQKEKIQNDINSINKIEDFILKLRNYENELEIKNKTLSETKLIDSILKINKNQIIVNTNYNIEIDSLNSKINELKSKTRDLKTKIQKVKLNNEKLNKFYDSKNDFYDNYNKFIKSFEKVNYILYSSNKVIPISKLPFLNKIEYDTNYRFDFITIFAHLLNNQISKNTLNNQYTDLVVSYNRYRDVNNMKELISEASLNSISSEIDLLFDNVKDLKIRIDLIDFEQLSQQVQRIIHLLEKQETYEYISAPIQPKYDLASFKVNISSKNKDIEVNNSREFTHNEFVRNGTRIDFSIGLATSYFWNTKTYEIYTKDSINKIGTKDNNLLVPSLVTMISMTKRSSKYVAFAVSAGLGVDITNGKIQMSNFFIGPSAVFGKYDRLILTGGFTLKNVGKLKNGYNVDDTLTQSNDINDVLTDKYKIGGFLSLTYNLTKNVRDKISKMK